MQTALRLTSRQKLALIMDSRSGLPGEICGILGGLGSQVLGIFPIPNTSSQPETSFYMEPQALYRVLVALEERGWNILAMYHSHPPGARTDPSQRDRAWASYPGTLQVIIVPGVEGKPDSVRAFSVSKDEVLEVQITIE